MNSTSTETVCVAVLFAHGHVSATVFRSQDTASDFLRARGYEAGPGDDDNHWTAPTGTAVVVSAELINEEGDDE